MKHIRPIKFAAKQKGLSLIELGVGLTILAAVVAGSLALYNSTSNTQKSTQFTSDMVALRSATKQLHYSSGTYGSANLNNVLVTANKVPATLRVTAGTPPTITHGFNGTVTVNGLSTLFSISATSIPQSECVNILTADASWSRVHVGTAPTAANALTDGSALPIDGAAATTLCASATNNIHFVSN